MVWACIFTHSKPEKTNMTTFYRVRGVVYNTKRAALKALGNMQESRAIAKMIEITGHDCDASGLTRLCERGVVYKGKRLPLLEAFFPIARSVRPALCSIEDCTIGESARKLRLCQRTSLRSRLSLFRDCAHIRSRCYSRLPRQRRMQANRPKTRTNAQKSGSDRRYSHRRRSRSCASNLH